VTVAVGALTEELEVLGLGKLLPVEAVGGAKLHLTGDIEDFIAARHTGPTLPRVTRVVKEGVISGR
jgi:hypothetical protein